MQDFALSAAAWIAPDFAQANRRSVDDTASYDVDEASLAQFEALLPAGPVEPVVGTGGDGESAGAAGQGGIGGIGAPGVAAATVHTAAMSQNEAGGRPRDERATQPDAIVSNYTIHHARLGVVRVSQSNGGGGVGALTLGTDDDALRARLRDAMPALRGALADVDGRGPDISVDA